MGQIPLSGAFPIGQGSISAGTEGSKCPELPEAERAVNWFGQGRYQNCPALRDALLSHHRSVGKLLQSLAVWPGKDITSGVPKRICGIRMALVKEVTAKACTAFESTNSSGFASAGHFSIPPRQRNWGTCSENRSDH